MSGGSASARDCPVCTGTEAELYLRAGAERIGGGHPTPHGAYTYLRCPRCQAVFLSELPSEADLRLYYDSEAYHFRCVPEREAGTAAPWREWARHRHLHFARPLPRRPPGRLLDFGCGPGDYLAYARWSGWEAVGVEYSDDSAAAARRRNFQVVTESQLDDLPNRAFDAVTMIHSLEHHPRPVEIVARLACKLRPEGVLFVEVPALDCHEYRLFGSSYSMIQAPMHLQFFSDQTVSFLADRVGLRLVSVRNNLWSPIHYVWSLLNLLEQRFGLRTTRRTKNVLSALAFPATVIPAALASARGRPGAIRQYFLRWPTGLD